jgi:hypothetical protein
MRRLLIVALSLLMLIVASALLMSWRGGGATNPPQPSRTVRLGCHTDWSSMQSVALTRLSREIDAHPDVRFFEVRWVNSWFFGFLREHQWVVDYDRQKQTLAEYHMESGPLQRWTPVSPSLVRALAPVGFDRQLLAREGAKTNLP